MGFAAVASVTEGRWNACSTKDTIGFGLQPGGDETTICHEIKGHHQPVVIGHVSENPAWRDHPTPALYGFESCISMPILLPDGSFSRALCAIDMNPRAIESPEVIGSLTLFADLIAFHLDAHRRIAISETALINERETAMLRERFIAVLGHDLRNPLQAVRAGTQSMLRHPSRAPELARHVENSIARMADLVDNTMDFARGRFGAGLVLVLEDDVKLEPALERVVDELRTSHVDRVITTTFPLQAPVRYDRARIAQILQIC